MFDRSLGKIVGHFYIGIVKKQIQLLFLILGIGDRLADQGNYLCRGTGSTTSSTRITDILIASSTSSIRSAA